MTLMAQERMSVVLATRSHLGVPSTALSYLILSTADSVKWLRERTRIDLAARDVGVARHLDTDDVDRRESPLRSARDGRRRPLQLDLPHPAPTPSTSLVPPPVLTGHVSSLPSY